MSTRDVKRVYVTDFIKRALSLGLFFVYNIDMYAHKIDVVLKDSIAYRNGIKAGDLLLSINGEQLEDIFDYQYQCVSEEIDVLIRHQDGGEELYHILKDEDEDLGLQFEGGLMDEYRHCSNKCIFCFIDQMPPGMRDNLYFKDDDARLSFLQGNYITLTNMSDHNVDRIIKYRLSPINISFQTMNPELRCKMLNNRFAGDALKKIDRFYEAGIIMNGQIVLCKGVNDGKELEYSLEQLYKYVPVLESVSVVPVGLTKYREGLYPLEVFTKEDAGEVIDIIEKWQKKAYSEHGIHFIHASDEWYITASRELPEEERYDGYLQLENGVGMVRSMLTEFSDGLNSVIEEYGGIREDGSVAKASLSSKMKRLFGKAEIKKEKVTVVTGRLVADYIEKMAKEVERAFPQKEIEILPIRNDFFGELITVSGLLTARDIIAQCKEKDDLGDCIILPCNVLQSDSDLFLDDLRIEDVEREIGVGIRISGTDGYGMLSAMLGMRIE